MDVGISCQHDTRNVYEGNKYEINYLHTDGYQDGDWIEIDGIRLIHERNLDEIKETNNKVPASIVLKDSLGPGKTFEAPYNSLSIAILIGNKLSKISESDSTYSSDSNKVKLLREELLMTMGIITVIKNDSSYFEVQTSKDYPASIEVLEL
jgi:hypothetical protein